MTKALENGGAFPSDINNEDNLSQRRSTVGMAISSFTQQTLKKMDCGIIQSENMQLKLYNKLDYVINEGMIDSVLSFICPIPVPASFHHHTKSKQKIKEPLIPKVIPMDANNSDQANKSHPVTHKTECTIAANEPSCQTVLHYAIPMKKLVTTKRDKKESEVVIHVCDEVKNITRDFICSQRLLVNKMGYFAEVTAGQKLEEVDISVHCDIQIFDWLIKWMKLTDSAEITGCRKTVFEGSENLPHLDANNVIPILVSAGFLQL
ncbi:PREDICTED: uncharacterized protein LOC108368564 [Rhagoletis zephyria]|uniref:uncharacterized protein LOC108368564 n=1 Tax=Rhagoletis zephyria TaxID=28612 RepID=UPI0008112955|nr:PREDICTED: uncharacterized protein LOC108368564 [Rhagoletis zephyria]